MLLLRFLTACACDCSVEADTSPTTSWSQDGITLDWEATNATFSGDVFSTTGPDAEVRIQWSIDGDTPARWWRQGWQSWSWSGVVEIGDEEPAPGGDGDTYSVLQETASTSWEAALLGAPGGPALHLGALSADESKVWFGITADELTIHWIGEGDPVRISSGTDPNQLWADWADLLPARDLGEPQTGWSDWYTYYGQATEEDILRNADAAQAMGLQLVQVDDGWERAWGDWEANDDFPSGTAGLAAAIQSRGLIPGLWMAPLLVNRSTSTYADHPDWWVTDEDGVELTDGACDCATIDITNPDAADWVAAQIQARVAEGWSYLKLDFLYAGAREGVRQEDINGAQAYARATQLLREAAGDAWILACGAPMVPSVGFADSYRSGADIAFSAFPDPNRDFLRWQARNTAARGWANGRWWWNDADNLMLAADPTAALAAQVASGGVWLYGEELPVDTVDLTALRGVRYVPEDPLSFVGGIDGSPVVEHATPDDTVPVRWVGEDGTVVLLNLGDTDVEVDGPGGTELISGYSGAAGSRTLAAGTGEVWAP